MNISEMLQSFLPSIVVKGENPKGPSAAILNVLNDLREERAKDLYELAQKSGERGAQIAQCQRELTAWREYARKLEQLCLEAGFEMPPGPEES